MTKQSEHVRWILEELPQLTEKGVLDPAAGRTLEEHYRAELAALPSPKNYFLLATGIIGGAFIAVGIILFFNYNWEILGKPVQISLSFLPLTLALLLSAFTLLTHKGQLLRECSALLTATGASTAIALLSQIYHTGGEFCDFMFLVMLLSVPLVYLFNSISLTAVYSFALFSQNNWMTPRPWQSLILLGAVLPMILYHLLKTDSPYRKVMRWVIPVCVLFGIIAFGRGGSELTLWFTAASLLFLCGIGLDERERAPRGNIWLILSFLVLTVLLAIGTFAHTSRIITYQKELSGAYWIFEGAMLAAFAAVFLTDLFRKRLTPERVLLLASVLAGFAFFRTFPHLDVILMLAMNCLLGLFGISLLRTGWRARRLLVFNGGFLMIAVLAGCRFCDIKIDVLPRAGMFILLGAGFIAANALLSRKCRKEASHD